MKFKVLKAAIAGLLTLVTIVTHAGIITDTTNDTFIDETTKLEWMDFGINNELSFDMVEGELGKDGEYNSWRLPTHIEVFEMYQNAFVGIGASIESTTNALGSSFVQDGIGEIGSVITQLVTVMGYNIIYDVGTKYETFYSRGWFIGPNGLTHLDISLGKGIDADLFAYDLAQYIGFHDHNGERYPNDSDSSTLLVRAYSLVNVPEPTTLGIFALGLMGLASHRFKKQ